MLVLVDAVHLFLWADGAGMAGDKSKTFNFTCMGAFLLAFAGLGGWGPQGACGVYSVCLDEIES